MAAALVVAAAVALPWLVDADRYGPLIAARVQNATGRTIDFGTISFRVLPVPGLSVRGPIRISDSAGYPGRSALTAESLTVRLGLLGLLRGRASVTSIMIDRPILTLIRDSRGAWNFDDLVRRATTAPATGPDSGEPDSFKVIVDRARITGGRIRIYDDAVLPGRRQELAVAPIDATIRGWGGDEPPDLDMSVGRGRSALGVRARLHAGGDRPLLTMQARGKAVRVEDLVLLLPWLSVARPAGLEVRGSLDLDGSAEVPLEHPEGLRFKGTLALSGVSYRDAAMALPVRDLSGTILVDGDRAEWRDFSVSAGSSSLRGRLQVENFLKPRIGFNLNSPRLDLNEIVATLVPAAPAAVAGAATSSGAGLKDLARGRLTGNLALSASGSSMNQILETARGTGALEIADGAVTSFSVLKQVAALLEMAGGKGIGRESTPFQSLRGSLVVADRRARTEDLTLLSQDLELEGKGWVGLDATLNLDTTARFSEESTRGMVAKNARLGGLTDDGRLVVYFTLQGDLASPDFRMNTRAQARVAEERAKEKLRSRLKDRLLKQLGQGEEAN